MIWCIWHYERARVDRLNIVKSGACLQNKASETIMKKKLLCGVLLLLLALVACSPSPSGNSSPSGATKNQPFTTGAIPDQDPEKLQRLYSKLATYLQKELGVPVTYKPVTDYTAAVTAFKVGDLDLVWFGGLTGVQAQLQVKGAEAIAQRNIDAQFHSIFVANKNTGLKPIQDVSGLKELKGHTFTFGSESSTSGRLMPQYFLKQGVVSALMTSKVKSASLALTTLRLSLWKQEPTTLVF